MALFQAVYASATLYSTRGDQIQRYGYAAFGLTATPCLVMSIVNLISTILTPDYPTIYTVRSEIMDEALLRKDEDAKFEGVVGSIIADDTKYKSVDSFTASFIREEDGKLLLLEDSKIVVST